MKLEISCFFADINDFCKILDFRIFSYGRGQKLTPEKPATGRRFRAFLQFCIRRKMTKNGSLKIAFFQLWPVRSRLYRLEILKIRPFGLRTRRDLTEYAKKKKNWIFIDFLSKFSRIISQRNRHGSGRALAHFFVGVCRWDLPIFSSIGDYGGESVCNRYNRKI